MYKNMGKVKRTLEEYVILTVATLILVVGVYVFKFPNNFSFGGVTGIAVVLSAIMPATPGNITFIINMALLVVGFVVQVALQAVLNVAVVTNTIPNTGISLPFFSSGGTSLMMLLGEMGVVLGVSRGET